MFHLNTKLCDIIPPLNLVDRAAVDHCRTYLISYSSNFIILVVFGRHGPYNTQVFGDYASSSASEHCTWKAAYPAAEQCMECRIQFRMKVGKSQMAGQAL